MACGRHSPLVFLVLCVKEKERWTGLVLKPRAEAESSRTRIDDDDGGNEGCGVGWEEGDFRSRSLKWQKKNTIEFLLISHIHFISEQPAHEGLM